MGLIGLGNMGAHMARNMLRSRQLVVHDTNPGAVEQLVGLGAERAASPRAVIDAGARTVLTMLPSNDSVRAVYTDRETGLLSSEVASGSQFIDCSTVAPEVAAELSRASVAVGCEFLDAPVSGGVGGAEVSGDRGSCHPSCKIDPPHQIHLPPLPPLSSIPFGTSYACPSARSSLCAIGSAGRQTAATYAARACIP